MRLLYKRKKIVLVFTLAIFLGQGQFFRVQAQEYSAKTVIPLHSFADQDTFDTYWNYLYPWGEDHNGTARMRPEQVRIENGELHITADRLPDPEGKSTKDPHLPIAYYAGAIHSKTLIEVNDNYPIWKLTGYFKAPVQKGTWPAFWITGSETWPPESDILEFKGDNINWQNTVSGKNWKKTDWQTEKTKITTAAEKWHCYALVLRKIDDKDLELQYYVDDELQAAHIADFVGKPFHIIVNLQMEGASGSLGSGPAQAVFRVKDIEVKAYKGNE